MPALLIAAGVYNVLWGTWVILRPGDTFRLLGGPGGESFVLWQCIGLFVAVYGIAFLLAARDPVRHWPIILVGLIGKVLGPVGLVYAASTGQLPWSWGLIVLVNDVIWWIPFAVILYRVASISVDPARSARPLTYEQAISTVRSQRGKSLLQLSQQQPVLAVFLRHAGCTFCREALDDLSQVREQVESRGQAISLIHMSPPLEATQMLRRFGLDDLHRFSDPQAQLYRAFGLQRGKFRQLFGPAVWWRGFKTAIFRGHGFGKPVGDGFQLPGVFLIHHGKILHSYRATTAADRPDYLAVATPESPAAKSSSDSDLLAHV